MRIFWTLIAISLCVFLWGQKPFYFIENGELNQIDTVSLDNVENYGQDAFVINLGNDGSPTFQLKPELEDLVTNDYSVLSYQRKHDFRYYNVYRPIVDAKYVVGTGQEQHFSLLHTQNINKKVNYTIGLNKINSKGIYLNQETNVTDVFFSSYGTDLFKKRYSYGIEINYISAAASLNGGLEDDSTFINDTLDLQNRELLGVNLLYADQTKRLGYGKFSQNITLYRDVDSNDRGKEIDIVNYFEYNYYSREFYDSLLNDNFYDRILNDSTLTNESLSYQSAKGFLGFRYSNDENSVFSTDAGVLVSQNWYEQADFDTSRLDIEANVWTQYHKNKLLLLAKLSYLVNDSYENKDYNIDVKGSYDLLSKVKLNGRIYLSNERPQIDLLSYSSNHVTWSNSFNKYQIQHYSIDAEYEGKWDASIGLNYFDIQNPIYFGYDKTPYQGDGICQLIRTSVLVNNKNNERWDLGGEFHYQYLGGYNVLRVPNILSKVTAAFKFKAFKKKMSAAIGTELIYFSKYETKDFDPVSGQYYIYSNREIGNYPYMNLFIKSRVQRATFFVMMSHPHQGLLGYNYFYFPSYPANDRFFRIGISWLFTN